MSTYSKQLLSGCVNGLGIAVSGSVAGSGVVVHTAVSGTGSFDEVWIYGLNTSASSVKTTVEWGETSNPIEVTIPGEGGLYLIVPGLLLQNEKVIRAFATTPNVIVINGFVNRIS